MSEKFIDLKIDSFPGNEKLEVQELYYKARMDELYAITLECSYSGADEIKTETLLGKKAAITISDSDGQEKKYLNGIVTSLHQNNSMNLDNKFIFSNVTITIEPALSLLGDHTNTRVFPAGNSVDYIQGIVNDYQIDKFIPPASYTVDTGNAINREFCIQYNETDLNFVKRLMESESIFYYFRHAKDGCTLKLGTGVADYHPDDPIKIGSTAKKVAYSSISKGNRVLTGTDVISDYDFKFPNKSLESADNKSLSKNVLNNADIKNYSYPYPVRSFLDPTKNTTTIGDNISSRRLASHQSRHETVELIVPNVWQKFDLGKKIEIEGKQGAFVVTEYNLTINNNSETGAGVTSRITAISKADTFCPTLKTPIPHIPSQTATVVGEKDRTVFNKTIDNADKNIFAKVKFHWDIDLKHTKDSADCSCWIRVAQAWSGPNRGFIFPPRVGDEVLIHFESGHPDMPLITGGAFNGMNTLPFSLKDNKNVSGIVSQSIGSGNKHGGRSSAILFKDDVDKEEFSLLTKGQQVNVVGKDSLEKVGGSKNKSITGSESNTVGGDLKVKVGGGLSFDVGKDVNIKSGGVVNIEAANGICISVGGNFIHIEKDKVTIVGTQVLENSGGAAVPAAPVAPDVPAPKLIV